MKITRTSSVAMLVVVALLVALFVWPTAWSYGVEYWESPFMDAEGNVIGDRVPVRIRINRFTGDKQNQGGPDGEWGYFVW